MPHPLPASNYSADDGSVKFSFLSEASLGHVLSNVHFEKVLMYSSK